MADEDDSDLRGFRAYGAPEDLARRAAEVLATRIEVTAAFLFGSQVSGKAGEYSDVDVAVFTPARELMTWDEELDLALLVASQVAPHIDLQFFRPERMEHPRPGGFEREVLEHGKRVA